MAKFGSGVRYGSGRLYGDLQLISGAGAISSAELFGVPFILRFDVSRAGNISSAEAFGLPSITLAPKKISVFPRASRLRVALKAPRLRVHSS